jgi:uncharacterized membrane protein
MYSKVKILGHPLHPMLVGFPVAFYTATFVSFVAYATSMDRFWFRMGSVLNWAGVIMAAVAALPGFVDWAIGIPRRSAAKKTGLIHLALNVSALLVFLVNGIVVSQRSDELSPAPGIGLALSAIGVLLTIPAGFLGWSMVQDHHVGVTLSSAQEQLEPVSVPVSTGAGRPGRPLASH